MHTDAYQLEKLKFINRLVDHKGRLYLVTHNKTKQVLHVTTELAVARSMLDQLFGQLQITISNNRSLPNPFYFIRPWTTKFVNHKLTIPDVTIQDDPEYILLGKRFWATELLINQIKRFHTHLLQGDLPHQQRIYDTKAQQARAVIDDQVTTFERTYYVHGWSEIKGISLQQAATEIIFKHEENDIHLFQIEQLRLKYQTKIKNAVDDGQLASIINEFNHECITYGNI